MNQNDFDWKNGSIVIGCLGKNFVCHSGECSGEGLFFEKVSDILFSTEKFKETVYRYMYAKARSQGLNLSDRNDFYELVQGDELLSVLIEDDFLMSSKDMTKENMEKIRPVAKLLANLYAGSGKEFKDQETMGLPQKIIVPVDDDYVCVGENDTVSFLAVKNFGKGVATMLNVGPYGSMVAVCANLFDCLSTLGDRLLEIKEGKTPSIGELRFADGKEFNKENDNYIAFCNLVKVGLGETFTKMREENHGADGKTF